VKRAAVVALAGLAYAWGASGVAPFTTLAYVLITIPSALMIAIYISLGALSPRRHDVTQYYQRRAEGATLRNVAPWLVVLLLALALEVVGLALGGRSSSVPTLSTAVDHLLIYHWERWLLYVGWLSVGALPLFRLWHSRTGEAR
jgi:hypothetical protein